MKKIFIILTICIFSINIFAQDSSNLEINGYLKSDQRFFAQKNYEWAWNENRLNLELNKKSDSYNFYSQIWVRNKGFSNIDKLNKLFSKDLLSPFDFEIREMYIKSRGFVIENLDLTIGKQIINWGKADKINPTNNFNPYDFEDIIDFGRKSGLWAINAEFAINNNLYLQALWAPFFRAVNLPEQINLMSEIQSPHQLLILNKVYDTIIQPPLNIKNASATAFRLKGVYSYVDFSVSYMYNYDYLPYLSELKYKLTTPPKVDAYTTLSFYKNHIIGFDLSTNIKGINIWTEIAGFIPEKDIKMTIDFRQMAGFIPIEQIDSVLIEGKKPYWKYVLGFDYFFPYDIYLNMQYIHGFLHERGKKELNDYFFARLEKSFMYDKLKLIPLQGGIAIADWKNVKNNYGFVYIPEIIYKPVSDLEFSFKTILTDGKGDLLFSKISKLDAICFAVKYNF